jgi:hypothetical protein
MTPEASSPTPQARKLGIKEGSILGFERLPPGWRLSDPPGGVEIVADPSPADVIVAFFSSAEDIAPALPGLGRRIYPAGMLWVAWPRRTAGRTRGSAAARARRHQGRGDRQRLVRVAFRVAEGAPLRSHGACPTPALGHLTPNSLLMTGASLSASRMLPAVLRCTPSRRTSTRWPPTTAVGV